MTGKETILNIQLQEKFYHSDEIIVYGNREKDKPINNTAVVSARTFSIEESNRYNKKSIPIIQQHGNRYLVVNPPSQALSKKEMDAVPIGC